MFGVEANSNELAWLVADVEAEASECAPVASAWVGPMGGDVACLMGDVVSSYVGDDGADVGSISFEPFVVKDVKPNVTSNEQNEGA